MPARILVVDDHPLMREGLRGLLEKEPGFDVVGEAATGREAVRRAAELRPDVAIVDIEMRDMNGIEATRQIVEADDRVRVVALSSHSQRHHVVSILRAGASGYVLKANAYEQLRRALRSVLAGKTYLCEEVAAIMIRELRACTPVERSVTEILSAREREILQLVAEGHSSPAIAARLHVSASTVETHRRNLMRKLGLHNVAELTKYAIREGLTSAGS